MSVMAEKERKPIEDAVSIRELRDQMADVLAEVTVWGRTINITSRGRRVAHLVTPALVIELETYRKKYGPLSSED